MPARDIGRQWEDAALAWLQAAGLRLIERNFHCRYGEIDLIVSDGDTVVFAELVARRVETDQHERPPQQHDGAIALAVADADQAE